MTACSSPKEKNEKVIRQTHLLSERKTEVSILKLEAQLFNHELISNGRIEAAESADLYFQSPQTIARIHVKNGDRVRKGEKIAELDSFKLHKATLQAKELWEQSLLELQEVLIGQGYSLKDSAQIPAEILRLAKLRSGYEQQKSRYELACYEQKQAILTAPFGGIVANLSLKAHNTATNSVPFCRIINTQEMETNFTVLESELPLIHVGDEVTVIPYANRETRHRGKISQINPLVDEKGMVTVKATLPGSAKLYEGMNVRVHVLRSMEKTLVIPKTALVLRNGREVVFTLKNGKSYWNYVQTGLENSDSYTITEGLQTGDSVIITGTLNLAHESPVLF